MKAMWKRVGVSILMLVLLSGMLTIASADEVVKVGIITCTNASLRSEPNTRASRYDRLSNGDLVPIIGEEGDFYIVDLASVEGLKEPQEGVGYVLKDYVVTGAYRIKLQKTTKVYSNPWKPGPAVAEKVKDTTFLVLSEDSQWYCIQLNDNKAGVGFIKKSDLGYYTYNYYYQGTWYGSQYAAVLSEEIEVRANPHAKDPVIGVLTKDTIVRKHGQPTNGYQAIECNYNGSVVMAYVPAAYLIDVYGEN